MFWGIVLKSDKKYECVVDKSFHVSMAALESTSANDSICLKIFCKDIEFIAGYLNTKTPQQALDLNFESGESVSMIAVGSGTLHLTGYQDTSEDEYDDYSSESDMENEVPVSNKRKLPASAGSGEEKSSQKKRPKILPAILPASAAVGESDSEDSDDEDFQIGNGLVEEEDDSDLEEEDGAGEDSDEFEEVGSDEDLEMESFDEDDEDDSEDDEKEFNKVLSNKKNKAAKPSPEKKKPEQKKVEPKKSIEPAKKGDQQQARKSVDAQKKGGNKNQQQQPKVEAPKSPVAETESAKKKKKKNKKNKNKENNGVGTPTTPTATATAGKVEASKTPGGKGENKGGVFVSTLSNGSGPVAKSGKQVVVYYRGKLKSNGKEFDSNMSGKGFKFTLGKGEVIKGWDKGVEGMKVGEKRRIEVPPKFGYGSEGAAPAIPPNATLVFDVELKAVS